LLALASFVAGLLGRSDDGADPVDPPGRVVLAAPAPFAANGYARARLLRQLYGTGALTPADTLDAAG
jgi:hypothetical protein